MAFRYSCFISYPSKRGLLLEDFIRQLKVALSDELSLYLDLPVFIDEEGLTPGRSYDKKLAAAICESICMIPIVVPVYFSSVSCLAEYVAMEKLEEKRLALLPGKAKKSLINDGLIIPVILRGSSNALPLRLTKRHYVDFSHFTTASGDIRRDPAYGVAIQQIAKHVHGLYQVFSEIPEDLCADCSKFELPSKEELTRLMEDDSPSGFKFPLHTSSFPWR